MYRRVPRDNPATLDPAPLTDIYGQAVVSQIFDSLVQFDAHLRPLPALAKLWEASRDRRTWTFTLRRGVKFHHGREVKFHHGREVTAHDFIYSFTRLLRVRSPTSAINFFEHIQAAKEFLWRSTSWAIGPSR
jgi:peptide/nickel transport system substrate-binding protein/oligopeptide transport system substrate-binding protein